MTCEHTHLLGPTSGVSESAGVRWDPVVCISNKSPGDEDVAVLGPL